MTENFATPKSKLNSEPLSQTIGQAAKALEMVLDGKSFNSENADLEEIPLSPAAKHWLYEALRGFAFYENQVLEYFNLPEGKEVDSQLLAILLITLSMFKSDRHHGLIVNEAVNAAKKIKTSIKNPASIINAVLRQYLRDLNNPDKSPNYFSDEEIKYRFPHWWISLVKNEYPNNYQKILIDANLHPPLCLRVNLSKISFAEYLQTLIKDDIEYSLIKKITIFNYQNQNIKDMEIDDPLKLPAIIINKPLAINKIPGFSEGLCSVQDSAAMRALTHLDITDGQLILDACSAPGGKACHLAEYVNLQKLNTQIIALEIDKKRAQKIIDNKNRLSLPNIKVQIGDILFPQQWLSNFPQKQFERILIDAPCSGSGTIRRHPDGKWLRREDDLDKFHTTQVKILQRAWELLKPNGRMLYATCSNFSYENECVLVSFIEFLQKKLFSEFYLSKKNQYNKGTLPLPTILKIENIDFVGGKILMLEKIIPTTYHDGHFYAVLQKN